AAFSVGVDRERSTGGRSLPVREPSTDRMRNRTKTATTMAIRVGRSRESSIWRVPCARNVDKLALRRSFRAKARLYIGKALAQNQFTPGQVAFFRIGPANEDKPWPDFLPSALSSCH